MTVHEFMDWNGQRIQLLGAVNDLMDQLDPYHSAWDFTADKVDQEVVGDIFGGLSHVQPRSKYIITDPWAEAPREAAIAGATRPVQGFEWPPRRPGSLEGFCAQEGVHSVLLDAEGAVCSFRMEETLFRTTEQPSGLTGAYDVVGQLRRRRLLQRLGRSEGESGPRTADELAKDVRYFIDGVLNRPVL